MGIHVRLIREAGGRGPARGRLACANLAHGFAATGSRDKKALRGMVKPNIAIVSSYNDMLSAHAPFEKFPAQLKKAVIEAGGMAEQKRCHAMSLARTASAADPPGVRRRIT